MVATRSSEVPKRQSKDREYWEEKKRKRTALYNLRLKNHLKSSSSSSSDSSSDESDFYSEEMQNRPQEPTSNNFRASNQRTETSIKQESESDNNSDDSSSSETQVLKQAGRRTCTPTSHAVTPRESEDFISNANDNTDTSIRRKLPYRKVRHSIGSTVEDRTIEKMLENESEWSFSDGSSSSFEESISIREKIQFNGLLRKTSQKYPSNGQLKKKSSVYSSDSEIEKISSISRIETTPVIGRNPMRTIRTPRKYREFVLSLNSTSNKISNMENSIENPASKEPIIKQSNSPHEETRKENSDNFQVKTTPCNNDPPIQSFEIRLTRHMSVIPTTPNEPQSKEVGTNEVVASTSGTKGKDSRKESNEKVVESHQDVEDLLQQLHGSTDSEAEETNKKSLLRRKLEFDNSGKKNNRKKSPTKRKLSTPTKKRVIPDSSSDSDFESKKENPLRTPVKRMKIDPKKPHSGTKNQKHNRVDSKSPTVKKSRTCQICEKKFSLPHVLRRHIETEHENRKLECADCGKKVKRKDQMIEHQKIEHLSDFYKCSICDHEYRHKHTRDKHEKTHKKTMRYKCKFNSCGRRFACRVDFKNHIYTMHFKKDERTQKYTCDHCDQTFLQKYFLRMHIQQYSKTKKTTGKTTEKE